MTAAALATANLRANTARTLAIAWRWWLGEIKAMVPSRVTAALVRNRAPALLLVGDGHAELRGPDWDSPIPLPYGSAESSLSFVSLPDDIGTTRLRLCLRSETVLHTVLSFPAAVEENLREVLTFELDRRTPFAAGEARFAYRIVDRDRSKGQIRVALAVAPRATIAEAMTLAERLGASVEELDLSADPGSGELLTGLHDGETPGARTRHGRSRRLAAVAAAAIALAAAALPVWRSHQETVQLRGQVAAARSAAGQAAKLEDEIARLSGDAAFLIARKQRDASAIALLAEVTHQVPDDTWLEDFSFDATDLSLRGYSSSSSALIKRLSASNLMTDPHFESPVTVEGASGRERFEIRAHRVVKQDPVQ